MRLANLGGRATVALVADDGTTRALDVHAASGGSLSADPMILSGLTNHDTLRSLGATADTEVLPVLDEARLGSPVPRPPKGFGVALNYRSHAIEAGRDIPIEPHLFGKTENCVCGPFDEIVVPSGRGMVDYEAELVIVFGKTCAAVDEQNAWSCLAGVTCGQDISDRQEQFRAPVKQFTIAKTYDTFGPIGPYLVTPDELANPDGLELEGRLNGEVMQHGNTDDLIFSVPALVAWLSRYITFRPGDLVWTGTPSGVGEARTPPVFLKAGDVVETEIEGIGTMRNPVVEK
jgi:2-keto-4-pentenoate hydratase/2-oxohepta-3-ene-1,7-dioic acid hydratase in catechol pathway